jgi:hypothetical protein
MTAIMILHIRSKYTAVGEFVILPPTNHDSPHTSGRKEIVMFFWMYALIELLAVFLDSGVIPTSNPAYPVCFFSMPSRKNTDEKNQWFAAGYTGLVAATYCCLLINGFVGFQFAEDGTPLSLWVSLLHQCLGIFL